MHAGKLQRCKMLFHGIANATNPLGLWENNKRLLLKLDMRLKQ